jgi:nucleoid-associated protein YgaU
MYRVHFEKRTNKKERKEAVDAAYAASAAADAAAVYAASSAVDAATDAAAADAAARVGRAGMSVPAAAAAAAAAGGGGRAAAALPLPPPYQLCAPHHPHTSGYQPSFPHLTNTFDHDAASIIMLTLLVAPILSEDSVARGHMCCAVVHGGTWWADVRSVVACWAVRYVAACSCVLGCWMFVSACDMSTNPRWGCGGGGGGGGGGEGAQYRGGVFGRSG